MLSLCTCLRVYNKKDDPDCLTEEILIPTGLLVNHLYKELGKHIPRYRYTGWIQMVVEVLFARFFKWNVFNWDAQSDNEQPVSCQNTNNQYRDVYCFSGPNLLSTDN